MTKWIKWRGIDREAVGSWQWVELEDSENQLEVAQNWASEKRFEWRSLGCLDIEWELAEPPIKVVLEEFVKLEEKQVILQDKWLRIEKILMEHDDGNTQDRI